MKRVLAVLMVLVLLTAGAAAETAPETETVTMRFEAKSFPWYLYDKENYYDGSSALQLWFADGAPDLPFIDLNDWAILMAFIQTDGGKSPGYELTVKTDPELNRVVLTRENEYSASFDFDSGSILFDDYVAFAGAPKSTYMDISIFSALNAGKNPFLLDVTGSRARYGEVTRMNLAQYGIPMAVLDGKYLLPLQTLSAVFLSPLFCGSYFNGETVFITGVSRMENPLDNLEEDLSKPGILTPEIMAEVDAYDGPAEDKTEFILDVVSRASEQGAALAEKFRSDMKTSLYPVYAAVPAAERSTALARFGYNELCFELDCMYGLKESHSIADFDLFFQQTGLIDSLLDPDSEKADGAIGELVNYWLDDGHSGFISASCMSEKKPDYNYGYSNIGLSRKRTATKEARAQYPDAEKLYYETGDTAYITFDEFEITPTETGDVYPDYYDLMQKNALPNDTMGLIIQAHQQITRENSPIKNVVLDLSCNGGGDAGTAVFALCWFLGEAQVSQHNIFTGAQATLTYKADINLDREFDERDTLAGRGINLYCLISPYSFSCANLLPWAFKENGSVTLLGKVSGGGSCVVQPLTTAWGTSFQISGANRLAFVKNGGYYDVDRGVEPDHIIDSYAHFFDREALTEYIHSLY